MISVVICTVNRGASLKLCLAAMESMAVPAGFEWELVVVDNNSNDETSTVIDFCKRSGVLPIVCVQEPRQGKSYALNRGLQVSKGDIVAITDDDCIVDKNWLVAVSREFEADANIGLIGGRVELHDINDAPVSIRTFKDRRLLTLSSLFSLIPGCNMAFRREVFERVGEFDSSFGPGTRLVVEDADFIYRALKAGFKIVYTPDVLLYHNHGRRLTAQIRAVHKGYVIGRGGFYFKHILAGDFDILRMSYWEVVSLIKGACKSILARTTPSEEFRMLGQLALGVCYEMVQLLRFGRGRGNLGTIV